MAGMERHAYVRMLSAVYASMFLIRLAFGITVVTFALYLKSEGDLVYSLVVAASPLFELIAVPFAGLQSDRYGRKGVLLTGLSLGAISLYGLALTHHVGLLALVNALHGIAAAFIIVTTLAVIATYAPPERRGREMGFFNLANIFGWIGGFVVGFLLLDVLAGRLEYSFVISGALATAGLVYANRMIVLPAEQKVARAGHEPPSLRQLAKAVGNKRILLLTAPWLIVFMLIGALITFLPRVTGDVLQLSGGSTAIGVLVVGALLMASQYFWGRLADRHGRELIMLVGAIGFALLMGVIVYSYFEAGDVDAQAIFENVMSHWVLLVACLFTALAFAPAGLAAIADEAEDGAEGTTMSVYSLTLSLGFIVGPPVVGAISEQVGGSGMVIYFALLAASLLALVLARFAQRRPAKAAVNEA